MGLLDFLESDEAGLGLGLLAAGGPSTVPMGFGQRLAQGVDYARSRRDASVDRKFKQQLMQSQMAENASQDALRRAQIAKLTNDQAFLGALSQRLTGGPAAPSASFSAGVTPGVGGAGGTAPMGAPAGGGMGAAAGGGGFPLSFGETVMAKLHGHDLMDAYKYANEPQELKPGSIYRNRTTGAEESIPSFSQDGKATGLRRGPTGEYEVYVPNGAANAYRTFKNIDAGVAPGKGRIGASGRMEPTSVAEDLGITQPPAPNFNPSGRPLIALPPAPGAAGNGGGPVNGVRIQNPMAPRAGDTDRAMIYGQELREAQQRLASATTPDEQRRAQYDIDSIQQEMRSNRIPLPANFNPTGAPLIALPPSAPGAGRGAMNPPAAVPAQSNDGTGIGIAGGTDFSPAEKAAQEAQRTRMVKTAEAQAEADAAAQRLADEAKRVRTVDKVKQDVASEPDKKKAIIAATDAIRAVDEALVHPGRETATGLSSVLNPKNYIPGTDAYNFKVRTDQLKGTVFRSAYEALKGAGQVTELEGTKAENAIARMDRAQSDSEFKQALEDYRGFLQRAIKTAGGEASEPTGNNRNTFAALPPASQFKGRSIRDTTTGKLLRSDGMSWKAAE